MLNNNALMNAIKNDPPACQPLWCGAQSHSRCPGPGFALLWRLNLVWVSCCVAWPELTAVSPRHFSRTDSYISCARHIKVMATVTGERERKKDEEGCV